MAKKTKKTTAGKKIAKKAVAKKKAKKKVVKAKKKTAKKKVAKKKAAKKKTAKKKAVVKKSAKKKAASKKKAVSKKKTVKKAAKKTTVKRKRRSKLTPKELEHFRGLLMEKQKEIIGDVNAMEAEALRKSRLEAGGDLSSMPIHMADMGTDNFEQEFSLGLLDSERKMLVDIVHALNKIDVGKYGICEGTGKMIIKPRLEANPWAKYCIEYATMVEKGLVIEGERVDDFDEEEEEEKDVYEEEAGEGEESVAVEDEIKEDDHKEKEKSVYDLFEDDEEEEEEF